MVRSYWFFILSALGLLVWSLIQLIKEQAKPNNPFHMRFVFLLFVT